MRGGGKPIKGVFKYCGNGNGCHCVDVASFPLVLTYYSLFCFLFQLELEINWRVFERFVASGWSDDAFHQQGKEEEQQQEEGFD
jgi:hypothetical protein